MPATAAPLRSTPAPTLAAPATPTVIRETTVTLGEARGNPRYYAQGKYLARAGFLPGRYLALETIDGGLVIRVAAAPSDHRVSAKSQGEVPVIDLNTQLLRRIFGTRTTLHVRIERDRIVLTRRALDARIEARLRDGSVGSVFAGGGLGDLAARQAGLTPRWAVELEERYAELHEQNFPEATLYRLTAEEASCHPLPPVETLLMGVPCEPFSMAARTVKGTGGRKREAGEARTAHPLGHLTFTAFAIVMACNPRTVIVENAPAYAASEIGVGLAGALRSIGYHVDVRVVNAGECGYLTQRKRTVIVAQTPEADGSVPSPWPALRSVAEGPYPTVGALLDPVVAEERWFTPETKAWVFDHAAAQQAKGNGFRVQGMAVTDTTMPTTKKRMLAGQGDSPMVIHPERPDTYRWLTLTEFARVMGAEALDTRGIATTTAGEALGQGWHVGLFAEIIARATGRAAAPGTSEPTAGTPIEGTAPEPDEPPAARASLDAFGDLPLFGLVA